MSENPFSSLSRENLEDQLMKNLKYIKTLRKQIQEGIHSVEQLEQKNKEYIEENDKLVDKINMLTEENEKLRQNNAAAVIENIGKTITSIIGQKKNEFVISTKLDITNIVPYIGNAGDSDSPQMKALKIELESMKQKINNLTQSESSSRQFSDVLQSKLEVSELAKNSYLEKCNFLQQSLDKANSELNELNNLYKTTQNSLTALQQEFQQYRQKSSDIESQIPLLNATQQELKSAIEARDSAIAQYEHLKEEVISLRVTSEESSRQAEQLKDGLKKSMRNDKEKDEIIQKMKQKLEDAEIEKNDLLKRIEYINENQKDHTKREMQLQEQIKELQIRLVNGKASEETENKVKKMNKMLEKSNILYAELEEKANKSDARVHELEIQLHKAKVPGLPFVKFVGPRTTFVLYDNGVFQENADAPNAKTILFGDSMRNDVACQVSGEEASTYPEQLMRQYFMSSDDNRKTITPIIMRILGFDDSAIKHETNKSRSVFKLF